MISRAIVELFNSRIVANQIVFRGGTALHKLFLDPPVRYSEDIDLVQRDAGPIGPLVEVIRAVLDPWLGSPKRSAGPDSFTLHYRFDSTFEPVVRMPLKIEINTREHFAVHGITGRHFVVSNRWFSGACEVATYTLSELLATKLRALYQRKKGRDLFDLAAGLANSEVDTAELIVAFQRYMEFEGSRVTRAQFEANMAAKMADPAFRSDGQAFVRTGVDYEPNEAWALVHSAVITKIPGEPWKGAPSG